MIILFLLTGFAKFISKKGKHFQKHRFGLILTWKEMVNGNVLDQEVVTIFKNKQKNHLQNRVETSGNRGLFFYNFYLLMAFAISKSKTTIIVV